MKKLISITLTLAILACAFSGCGKKEETTTSESNQTTSIAETENDNQKTESEENFDYIDNSNNLLMTLDNYYNYKKSAFYYFYDDNVVIAYFGRYDEDNEINNIDYYKDYFICIFDDMLVVDKNNINYKDMGKKKFKEIEAREFEGTVANSSGEPHPSKAYTFLYGGRDCIVAATTINNSDSNTEQMERDIEVFMNNLRASE